ncbi:MAG: AraC family transcriptional regulator [Planctomycetota bacterium]
MGGQTRCGPTWASRPGGETIRPCKVYSPLKGSGWVGCDGIRTSLKPGWVHLLPGDASIEHGCARSLTLDWLHFEIESLRLATAMRGVTRVQSWRTGGDDFWQPAIRDLNRTLHHPTPTTAAALLTAVMHFVSLALEAQADGGPTPRQLELLDRLDPAIRYMDDHDRDNPPLAVVAAQVHLSPEYFHRLFEEATGKTPHAYMLARRMSLALRLLVRGNAPVAQVGEACGYANPYYFSRAFKRYFGASPRAARRGLMVQA